MDDPASSASAQLQQREKYLYTYESKMAFFTRMASSVAGAELLLESGLMVRLAEMRVFSARPEATYQISSSEATPSRSLQVYRQILFPALRLCLAVLSCLGSNNVSAVVHVKHFVKANEQVTNKKFFSVGFSQLIDLLNTHKSVFLTSTPYQGLRQLFSVMS